MAKGRRCVLCVGNELCEDDGIGLVLGRMLGNMRGLGAEVHLVSELSLAVLDHFLAYSTIVVIDAELKGSAPGRVSVTRCLSGRVSPGCAVGHAMSLSSLLELSERLRGAEDLPKVLLVGIEPGVMRPFVERLSAPVRAAVPRALRVVIQLLRGPGVTMRTRRPALFAFGVGRGSPPRVRTRFGSTGTRPRPCGRCP